MNAADSGLDIEGMLLAQLTSGTLTIAHVLTCCMVKTWVVLHRKGLPIHTTREDR